MGKYSFGLLVINKGRAWQRKRATREQRNEHRLRNSTVRRGSSIQTLLEFYILRWTKIKRNVPLIENSPVMKKKEKEKKDKAWDPINNFSGVVIRGRNKKRKEKQLQHLSRHTC